jgi:RNA polymerase sigma-70 factor (ECF subfamily)
VTNADERFEALFNANFGDVLAYAARRCPSQQDAEDLVAETFAVAWRRMTDIPQGTVPDCGWSEQRA